MRKGFTLIELSIVLVVIGLVVGGVLVGQDLIRASKLRNLTAQISEIDTAVNTFKLTYDCLPGDCANATQFFSGTLDGNGSKYVNHRNAGTDSERKEHWNFWRHLGLAGLIAGEYTGIGVGSGNDIYEIASIGVNVPKTSLNGVGITIYHHKDQFTSWSTLFGMESSLHYHLMLIGGTDHVLTHYATIPVGDTMMMDEKTDDGIANTGYFRTTAPNATIETEDCVSGTAPNYAYDTTDLSALCSIVVLKDW